jgi:hypothetical protein
MAADVIAQFYRLKGGEVRFLHEICIAHFWLIPCRFGVGS